MFFLVLLCVFFTYAGVIGLIIDTFCHSKVLYYCWEERDSTQSKKMVGTTRDTTKGSNISPNHRYTLRNNLHCIITNYKYEISNFNLCIVYIYTF